MTSTSTQNRTRRTSQRIAHRDYCRQRSRQIAYGQWHPWTDAAPVRDHIHHLRQAGASYSAIADAAHVSPSTVRDVMTGYGRKRPDRIRTTHARRLLAVRTQSCGQRRDACGSRRRLQALVALGHPPGDLARQVGISRPRLRRILDSETQRVSTAVHRDIRALYDQLWNQAPGDLTGRQRLAVESARRRADAAGWPPPMALGDEKIDETSYQPRATWRRAVVEPG
jgi:AraC-like DNA-binding protein